MKQEITRRAVAARRMTAAIFATTVSVASSAGAQSERAGGRADDPAPGEAAPSDGVPDATVDEPQSSWMKRYDQAREALVNGQYLEAREDFLQLANEAPTALDRRLAVEMALLSSRWADGAEKGSEKKTPDVRPPRTRDEITILYTNAFIYGAGSGAWFLLQMQPSTALTATLPFLGITAAPVVAVALADGHQPFPRGVPHGIAAGAYLGLGESILVVGYQHARSHRLDAGKPVSSRWKPEDVATVLWSGATAGALMGGMAANGLGTTPGRVSYAASAAMWSGMFSGFVAGAVLPQSGRRTEDSLLTAMIGYNAGLATGLLTAASVSPSATRMRLVDLSGVAGGLTAAGLYVSLGHGQSDSRGFLGATSLGGLAGLAAGWLATSGMPRDTLAPSGSSTVAPMVQPTSGGLMLGVAGKLDSF